jgi:hypothetical protein
MSTPTETTDASGFENGLPTSETVQRAYDGEVRERPITAQMEVPR